LQGKKKFAFEFTNIFVSPVRKLVCSSACCTWTKWIDDYNYRVLTECFLSRLYSLLPRN